VLYAERYWKTGQGELFDALYHQAVSTIEETITYIEGYLQKNTQSSECAIKPYNNYDR
jgi:two-component system, OmpR family, aerobic respiration control sensor histidine kinase ArcB